jgi:SAM-dependent methyltransferase
MSVEARARFAGSEDFLREYAAKPLEQYEPEFEAYLRRIGKFIDLEPGARVLEVGAGSGWFMVLCRRRGIRCEGIEHNPFCIELAKGLGRRNGFDLDIQEANVESLPLPPDTYDLIVAMSVLEHVADYRRALTAVHRGLKPGGVFFLTSTNKFSFRSGEYPLPLYGWLPYRLRRAIRVLNQGPRIVDSAGIDFNQFTYFGLRRDLLRAGFTDVYDKFDFLEPDDVARRTPLRLLAANLLRIIPPLRLPARVVDSGTCFIAVK